MSRTLEADRKTIIYTLSDPETGEIRYIGKTTLPLKYRLTGHLYTKKERNGLVNHRINWIQSIVKRGLKPIIIEIDSCKWEESQALEIYYIAKYKKEGYRLVNTSMGGEGNLGVKLTDYQKLRRRESSMKTVYQYKKTGEFVKKWECMTDAAKATGSNVAKMTRSIKIEKYTHHNNFVWNYEPMTILEVLKKSKVFKIHKLDMNGNLLAIYNSVQEAADKNNICDDIIHTSFTGQRDPYNKRNQIKFLWKKVYVYEEIESEQ